MTFSDGSAALFDASASMAIRITIGPAASDEELAVCRATIVAEPRNWIAQEVVSLSGGIAGFWLESTGGEGAASVEVTSARFAPVKVALDVRG